ncbi:unnamed protein product [Urochloa humidicola]
MGLEPEIMRIRRELRKIWVDPPAFCRPGASPVTDLLHWEVVIDGPDGSPFAGGTFPVDVDFVGHYPFQHPKITFKTKVYHPSIDSEGEMMLDIFQYNWSPAMTVHKLLLFIVSVLYDPMLDGHRRQEEEEEMSKKRAAASLSLSPPAPERRIASLPRVTLKRVVAFLQGWSVALPFATSRRRFSSTVLPLSNCTGRACF